MPLLNIILKELKRDHKFWIGFSIFTLSILITFLLPLGQYSFKVLGTLIILYVFLGPSSKPRVKPPTCSVCGSIEEVIQCKYCKKPLCPSHRVGTGDLSQGYTCQGFWVNCKDASS